MSTNTPITACHQAARETVNTKTRATPATNASGRVPSCRFALLTCTLLIAMGTTAQAQSGGIVSTGTVLIGNTPCPFATVVDPTTTTGVYVRIWLGGNRVMQVWPTEIQGTTLMMNFYIYQTMGQHWTLQGGVDRPVFWIHQHAGEIQLDGGTVPAGTTALLNGGVAGRGRRTFWAHDAANVRWNPMTEPAWTLTFMPATVNPGLLGQFLPGVFPSLRTSPIPRRTPNPRPNPLPQPNPPPRKGLTDISVDRHKVVIKLWDYAKEDGDMVDLYLNGKYQKRLTLTKGGTSLTLNLATGYHRLTVRALNEGTDKPNTAAVSVTGVVKGNPRQSWRMNAGQQTTMGITVQPR